MFTSFHQYWLSRRPQLDDALGERISYLLDRVSVGECGMLHPALNGGKKLRGVLLGMVTEVLGGEWQVALPRAVAVEMIQAATLIHDDFVDQDRMRRYLPAVWTLEGARRAVLLGDVIFANAIHMMSEIGADEGRVVSRAIAEISRGALMEPCDPLKFMRQMKAGGDGDHYEKIIHLKTGVLFEAACELGALSAGADDEVRKQCRFYGSCIGEAYQMADDIKEIKELLADGVVHSHEIALLAPAILSFACEARPHILSFLSAGPSQVSGPLRKCMERAADRMGLEIRHRLKLAVDQMQDALREKTHGRLGVEAPAELLGMFDAS